MTEVYDYSRGEVISGGVVVDRIYDYRDYARPRSREPSVYVASYMLPKDKRLLKAYYMVVFALENLGYNRPELRELAKKLIYKSRSLLTARKSSRFYASYSAAVAYYVLKSHGVNVDAEKVVSLLGATRWRFYEILGELKNRFGAPWLRNGRRVEVLAYIDRFVSQNGHPDGLYKWCLWVLQRLDDYYISGKNTRVLAAAIVDLARILLYNEVLRTAGEEKALELRIRQDSIAGAIGCSVAGMRVLRKNIMEYLEKKGYLRVVESRRCGVHIVEVTGK